MVRLSVAAKASFENGDSNPFRRWPAGTGAVIFALTLIVYLPALTGGFLWNDSDYVTRGDLQSLDGLRRIWTVFGATEQYIRCCIVFSGCSTASGATIRSVTTW